MASWQNTLIRPETAIRSAIETIDKNSIQIALVVDNARRLLGTVTDGDIRRAILKGIGLDEKVERIMKTKPITAKQNDTRETILNVMKKRKVHQVPILDEEGGVTGVEVLDELIRSGKKDNWVLLMAGGLGSRLKPVTDHLPKPMIAVGQKPILETILENFLEYGFRHFFISVNYKNEMIRDYFGDGSKWGIQLRYLSEGERLGTAGALGLLPEKPSLPLIVMNGDLLTKVNFQQLLSFHAENRSDATTCVRDYEFQVPYGVAKLDGHKLLAIDEKPVKSFFVNAGIYVLQPAVIESIPQNEYLDMPHLFEKLIAKKSRVSAFPVREYWIDIGQMDDLKRASSEFPKVFE